MTSVGGIHMRNRTLTTAIVVASASLVAGLAPAAVAATPAAPATPAKPVTAVKAAKPGKPAKPAQPVSDFNADGYRDLVIQQAGSFMDSRPGSVVVLYGSKTGVSVANRQIIDQDTPGVPGTSENSDRFGGQAIVGDYDGDGITDLAISADGEDMSFGSVYRRNAGQITIVWGGKKGLTRHGGTTLKQTVPTAIDIRRGYAVVGGDFNGDGITDLATNDRTPGRGGDVLYGPVSRKTGAPKSIAATNPRPDRIAGVSVRASGDMTGDGIADLVVHSTYDRGPGQKYHGQVELWPGTKKGLTVGTALKGADGKTFLAGSGNNVAVGDLDRDGHADLAVGGYLPGGTPDTAGHVQIVYGGPTGQSTTRAPQMITQDTPGVPDEHEVDDYFGTSVSIGDINADGYGDLAVGAAGESFERAAEAGQVTTLPGGPNGVTGEGARAYNRGTPGVPESLTAHDYLGTAVKLVDLNGDQRDDLAIATNGGDEVHEGRVNILFNDGRGAITGYGSHAYYAHNLGLTGGHRSGFGDGFGG
ncbi:FG-GAP and VCBS repeat-containing protein [Streptomyces sp. NPDC057638]|uniref:FG-GAP and VCBS repeat-containing protein n=1 Tax=Streptomyces sp. NPDC057638 TaxID=3346190 RepID=UPI003691C3B2